MTATGLLGGLALDACGPFDLDGLDIPPPTVEQLAVRRGLINHKITHLLGNPILEATIGKELYTQLEPTISHPQVARHLSDEIVRHFYAGEIDQDAAMLLDRYGHGIEYDLHKYCGLDVLDFFRGVLPWPKLVRLAFRFPIDGFFRAEYEMDYERAGAVLEAEEADKQARRDRGETVLDVPPPMSTLGFSTEVSTLTNIYDALRALTVTVCNLAGAKAPSPIPSKRPRTALDDLRQRHEMSMTDDLLRRHGVKV